MPRYEQITRIPITFQLGVYNEEERIRPVLEHASRWADEIIIVNKSSTDKTKEVCLEYGNKVKVIDVPFSPKGHEDMLDIIDFSSNDWIFFATASEIPTFNLIKHVRQVLDEANGQLDLVYVPRKIYSFGINSPRSPWSISFYPFLLNRKRTTFPSVIHNNIKPKSPLNTYKIPYSDDCCVYHFTHPTARTYLNDMMQYFEAEVVGDINPLGKYSECFSNIDKYKYKYRNVDDKLFGLYCAWQIYWLGTALYAWEKQRAVDVPKYYADIKNELIQKEWSVGLHKMDILQNFENSILEDSLLDNMINVQTEDDLLLALSKQKICKDIKVVYVVGAHRFQEKELFFLIFPNLEKVYLFEPLPACFEYLSKTFKEDSRIEVFQYAIADGDFVTNFYVTNNDAASSSILPLGKHLNLFPKVQTTETISVSCKTLDAIIAEKDLGMPDMLFVDAQGAEFKIISALSTHLRSTIKIIFTETSKEELYVGARLLDDIKKLLDLDYYFVGFVPLNNNTPTHGNSLFINHLCMREFNEINDQYVILKSGKKLFTKNRVLRFVKKIYSTIMDVVIKLIKN